MFFWSFKNEFERSCLFFRSSKVCTYILFVGVLVCLTLSFLFCISCFSGIFVDLSFSFTVFCVNFFFYGVLVDSSVSFLCFVLINLIFFFRWFLLSPAYSLNLYNTIHFVHIISVYFRYMFLNKNVSLISVVPLLYVLSLSL